MRSLGRGSVFCPACAGADLLFGARTRIASHRRSTTRSSFLVGSTESKRKLARICGGRPGWLLANVAGCHHASRRSIGHTRSAEGCSLAFEECRPRIELVLEMEVSHR